MAVALLLLGAFVLLAAAWALLRAYAKYMSR